MTSQARQGSARVTATFDLSRDVDLALQDVQAEVAQTQRSLPKDVPVATVSKSNPDDTPILTIGVYGPFARQLLADVARYQVQEKLQGALNDNGQHVEICPLTCAALNCDPDASLSLFLGCTPISNIQ
jgi:multidrug efflux pump subunit AcrB